MVGGSRFESIQAFIFQVIERTRFNASIFKLKNRNKLPNNQVNKKYVGFGRAQVSLQLDKWLIWTMLCRINPYFCHSPVYDSQYEMRVEQLNRNRLNALLLELYQLFVVCSVDFLTFLELDNTFVHPTDFIVNRQF